MPVDFREIQEGELDFPRADFSECVYALVEPRLAKRFLDTANGHSWDWGWKLLSTGASGVQLFARTPPAPGQACHAWRRTGSCTPDGPREPPGDADCQAVISRLTSGFCECGNARIGTGCSHADRSCAEVCATGVWARSP